MDIAALSTSMSQALLSQNVGIDVAKMTLDNEQQNAAQLTKMIQASDPNLGNFIDLKG
ncbi:YjfB family protein [Sporolactobacillus sp. CQH2019]|uniref:YjfB family protein n=1 Tax=Sporolactobacillus sp. CQH2019 TaxID=3023512 RepID=UPI002367E7C6|nr:YjfB family protein [Sporolactobacillus sp. CQH2019]MDD9149220.1 YjfB family protein [Sporolactobacillus sp. CQH2019]